jgi:hypothetical protein
METATAYFLKNLPSLTGTFLDDFRTVPAGIFQNLIHARQLAQPGPPDTKKGRHCEKRRPSFGTFCPKLI